MINDASFRQKLHPISRNILRRQNPLEVVVEDVSTFDAENSIVGSLLWEIDLNNKQTGSDFIKSLPNQPGKEFEIQKRFKIKIIIIKIKTYNNKSNNSNNNNNNGGDLFPPQPPAPGNNIGSPPSILTIQDFMDPYPEEYDLQQRLNQNAVLESLLQHRLNNLRGISNSSPPPFLQIKLQIFMFLLKLLVLIEIFDQLIKLQGMIYSVHRLKH